jgi:uncharacterized membrane protein YfcA
MSVGEFVIALTTGLVAGAYAGLLGVGGGIVMVPAMVLLLGVDQQVAQGTSLLVIIVAAVAGTVANQRRGLLDRRVSLLLGAGGVAGSVVGALLALRVFDEAVLRRVFAVVLIVVGLRLARARPSPAGDIAPPP